MMDATTVALLVSGAAAGAAAGGGLAALWFGSQRPAIIEKAVVKTQDLNRSKSDARIEEIYEAIQKQVVLANAPALARPGADVTAAYIDLTAAIKRELAGLYDLGEGVFQMVLSIRNSLHEELELTATTHPLPADGETMMRFPHSPENQPARTSRASVNEEMKAFIQAFHTFWSQRGLRIAEMGQARKALGLPLTSDDKFVEAVVQAVG